MRLYGTVDAVKNLFNAYQGQRPPAIPKKPIVPQLPAIDLIQHVPQENSHPLEDHGQDSYIPPASIIPGAANPILSRQPIHSHHSVIPGAANPILSKQQILSHHSGGIASLGGNSSPQFGGMATSHRPEAIGSGASPDGGFDNTGGQEIGGSDKSRSQVKWYRPTYQMDQTKYSNSIVMHFMWNLFFVSLFLMI